ncbi:uncharacterized protein LOC101859515 [Aplysia californica]|uniref:Uncharacterized protein LOC101859515 n=1 Tax=Aplysia californica TaxID=6500 RepID=A0ABM1AA79_APLCA|nr:uncharacterized protein LOC101859515 [Aplysia californica]
MFPPQPHQTTLLNGSHTPSGKYTAFPPKSVLHNGYDSSPSVRRRGSTPTLQNTSTDSAGSRAAAAGLTPMKSSYNNNSYSQSESPRYRTDHNTSSQSEHSSHKSNSLGGPAERSNVPQSTVQAHVQGWYQRKLIEAAQRLRQTHGYNNSPAAYDRQSPESSAYPAGGPNYAGGNTYPQPHHQTNATPHHTSAMSHSPMSHQPSNSPYPNTGASTPQNRQPPQKSQPERGEQYNPETVACLRDRFERSVQDTPPQSTYNRQRAPPPPANSAYQSTPTQREDNVSYRTPATDSAINNNSSSSNGDNSNNNNNDDGDSWCGSEKNREKAPATMSFQNSTLPSPVVWNGSSYWASFTEKSFCRGNRFKVYSGIVNGDGQWRGGKCVVKVFKETPGTKVLCACEVKKSDKSRQLNQAFNRMAGRKSRVRTTALYWAPMDEVSVLKKLFFTGRRRLTTNEIVLFEDDLRVDEERPGKERKLTLYMDSRGRQPYCKAKDLEAFSHFSYHHSQGQLVVCGLEGVHDSDGFVVKTPTIHSREREFGSCDRGEVGIREVFEHHVCNEICRDLIKPATEEEDDFDDDIDAAAERRCSVSDDVTSSPPLLRQQSTVSQNTERMSDYLEPSAPGLHEDLHPFEPLSTPNPWMAGWMPRDQSENVFIHGPMPQSIQPHSRQVPISLPTQMSVDSELSTPDAKTPTSSSHNECTHKADQDRENANTTTSVSSHCCTVFSPMSSSACGESGLQIGCSQCGDNRRVRFSLSTGATSGIGTGFGTATTGSVANSASSSPTTCPRSIMKRQYSVPAAQCASPCQSSLAQLVFLQSSQTPRSEEVNPRVLPVFRFAPGPVPESMELPPSYQESQSAYCSLWLQQHELEMNAALHPVLADDANGNRVIGNVVHSTQL